MAKDVIELGDAQFQHEVLEAQEPVLVDFTATWCPPCHAISPILDALASEYRGRLKVTKINVDDNQETAQRYGIRALPSLLLFKEGKVVQQLVGARPRARLEEELRAHL
ncbi:thioredoxin [Myxococcus landrumensis]|uniref:Thioredoxin n=1 Tax=Myxococcus landrumensis TaxID=2813577 RepID=A0ABX7NH81_9BACT|nr:thioredoxin [Myxococcus landrumus]QSQ16945.1 thioredoxin [Myxococcus landrumus]